MELPQQIKTFKDIDTETLLNPDFGTKNFGSIKPQFDEFHQLISEMIDIAFEDEKIPQGIRNQIITITNDFNNFYNQIKSYSIDQDGNQQFRQHQQIINNFNNWYNWTYLGADNQNRPKNFFNVYNTCKNLANQNLSEDQSKLKKLLKDAQKDKSDIETILGELRKKSADETVVDYANIFKQQAEKYSVFSLKLKPWKDRKISIGIAEYWVSLALFLGVGLVFAIKYLTDIFPLNSTDDLEIRIIQLLTRFAFISFLIYLVTFCFKQYSISKHLFTLNKHRQNTLDSYKLFLASVDREDTTTRNALMMEVAKAIYEAGNTGYISSKNDSNPPSIIEMTRLIKDSK